MLNSTQGSLVMVGLNTETPQVFWNGAKVDGVLGIAVDSGAAVRKVVLRVQEDPVLDEMQAAGVIVRRVLA